MSQPLLKARSLGASSWGWDSQYLRVKDTLAHSAAQNYLKETSQMMSTPVNWFLGAPMPLLEDLEVTSVEMARQMQNAVNRGVAVAEPSTSTTTTPRPSSKSISRSLAIQELSEEDVELGEKALKVLGYGRLAREVNPLALQLAKLGIEVLDTKEVKAYQKIISNEARMKAEQQRAVHSGFARGWNWKESPISEYGKPIPQFVLSKAIEIKQAIPAVELYVEDHQYDPDPFLVAMLLASKVELEVCYVEVWDEPKFEKRAVKE